MTRAAPPQPPSHPLFVLAAAALLPGAGQVLNGMTARALVMLFFAVSLAVVSLHLTSPAHSFVGRHAGGFFVHAVMVLDAYVWARYRHALWRQRRAQDPRS